MFHRGLYGLFPSIYCSLSQHKMSCLLKATRMIYSAFARAGKRLSNRLPYIRFSSIFGSWLADLLSIVYIFTLFCTWVFCVMIPVLCVMIPVFCVMIPVFCVMIPVFCVMIPVLCVMIPVLCVMIPVFLKCGKLSESYRHSLHNRSFVHTTLCAA